METGASLVQALERHNHPGRALHRRRVRAFLENLGLHLESGADPQQAVVQGQLESQLQCARHDLEQAQADCEQLDKEVKRAQVALTKVGSSTKRKPMRPAHLSPAVPLLEGPVFRGCTVWYRWVLWMPQYDTESCGPHSCMVRNSVTLVESAGQEPSRPLVGRTGV